MTDLPSPAERQSVALARLRQIAQLLDSAVRIPFTPWRIGIDGIIGLIPGVGDMAGAILAGTIVVQALRLGAPAGLLARMLLNVAIDAFVGEIPLFGDLFDIGYKVNLRNVALLERHLADPRGAKAAGNRFLLLVLLTILLIVVATAALAIAVIVLLYSLVKHSAI